jgi:ribonucleoside-triphosphate reductase (formate)
MPAMPQQDQSKMNVTRRTCGYLGENFWNVGKTKEIKSRVLHL